MCCYPLYIVEWSGTEHGVKKILKGNPLHFVLFVVFIISTLIRTRHCHIPELSVWVKYVGVYTGAGTGVVEMYAWQAVAEGRYIEGTATVLYNRPGRASQ